MLTSGIDVSHHNGVVDWGQVAGSGVGFACAKATEGMNTQDAQFNANYSGMQQNNILRGAYHFFHPEVDAQAQAANFLQLVTQVSPGDLPPALDVEINGGQNANTIAGAIQQWLDKIEQTLGRTPVIYTSASFWNANLPPGNAFARYPLWVAHYTTNPAPHVPNGFPGYVFWQYSESGSVPGISGTVDMDWFNGDMNALAQLAGS
jgi:lysozyme